MNKLLERRRDLLAKAREITDAAEQEDRPLTAAESSKISSLTIEIRSVDQELAELRAANDRDPDPNHGARSRSQAHARGIVEPDFVASANREFEGARSQPSAIANAHTPRSFRSIFPSVPITMGPFTREDRDPITEHDDFWRAFVHRDRVADSRMMELAATQTTGVDSEGGVAMPVEVVRNVVDTALESSIVLPRAALFPMTSEKKRVWSFDGSSVSGGTLYGNASAQWVAEGGTATAVTLETKKIELIARKLFLLVEESREIVESGPGFSNELERTIGRALAWHADDAYLHGDGIGKPQGALTSANPARIAVPRQGAGAIDATDILAMAERLHPSMFNESIWITSNPCLDQISTAHVAGTNSDNFLFAPSRGESMPNTLLGRPILLSEKSPNLGTEADLALVAFSGYAVGLRQRIEIDQSMHVGFTRDTITLRGLMRTDGQSRWLSAFQPKDSNSATLSWCVVLTDAA